MSLPRASLTSGSSPTSSPNSQASRSSPSARARCRSVIARLLAVVTLGGQRHYLTRYHTVLFGKL